MTTNALDAAIRNRRTTKVFADQPAERTTDRGRVNELIAAATWAPFHRPANKDHLGDAAGQSSIVPWRFYVMDAAACRTMRSHLIEAGDAGKLPNMLAAADCVIQVTWLPDPPKPEFAAANPDALFEPTLQNMEHIAAASAAIENLLLAATDRGLESYWSTGGALRQPPQFEMLGIPSTQILLGAIFLFPEEEAGTTRVPGGLREKRGEEADWCQWVSLGE